MFGARKFKVYTVHVNPDKTDPADRVQFVREAFSVWAFLFNILWLLYNRLWLGAAGYLAAVTVLVYISQVLHLSQISVTALQLFMQFGLGFIAHDLQRLKLERKGFALTTVVAAENPINAQRRYYDVVA